MTSPMTCEAFADRLADYLEQDVAAARRAAMEAHAATCGACGPLLADMRELRATAADLPALAPSRDLWAGIAARIDTPVVEIAVNRPATRRWPRVPMAAAAALLIAAAGVTFAARGGWQRVSDGRAVAGASGDGMAQFVVNKKEMSTEAVYDQEIAMLRAVLEQRREQLDSATVAVIERNIDIIDSAIADSKAALARDPASRYLLESLNTTLDMKLELLRVAAALPSRT